MASTKYLFLAFTFRSRSVPCSQLLGKQLWMYYKCCQRTPSSKKVLLSHWRQDHVLLSLLTISELQPQDWAYLFDKTGFFLPFLDISLLLILSYSYPISNINLCISLSFLLLHFPYLGLLQLCKLKWVWKFISMFGPAREYTNNQDYFDTLGLKLTIMLLYKSVYQNRNLFFEVMKQYSQLEGTFLKGQVCWYLH